MYHKIEEQERNPENYVLTEIDSYMTEDECFSLFSKPQQTQKTIGLYLKKIKDSGKAPKAEEPPKYVPPKQKRLLLAPGSDSLEREVIRNKGYWVGKPQETAPILYKLKEKYPVVPIQIPNRKKKGVGIFQRPRFLELSYLQKLAKAGLLYPDEEISDSEEEVEPDTSLCLPLRKVPHKVFDPCKEKKEKKEEPEPEPPKDLVEETLRAGIVPTFRKIPTGCQCDFYGEHNRPPTVWDNPFRDRTEMLRQHEMNKVMKPFKSELLNKDYEKCPPVKFIANDHAIERKKKFPLYQISNL